MRFRSLTALEERSLQERLSTATARADSLVALGISAEQLADQLNGGIISALVVAADGSSYGDPAIEPDATTGSRMAPPPLEPDETATVLVHPLGDGGRVILVADTTEAAESYGRGLLCGERVYLRPLHEDDLPMLEQWWNNPAVGVLQHRAVRPQPSGPAGELLRIWSRNADSTAVGFSVVSRHVEQLLGHVALYGAEVASRSATLGIILGPQHTGQGHGSDATRVLLRYGFTEMGLHRIGLDVFAYNSRARATYRRLGFTEEGRRREVVFHDGRFHDVVQMSILKQKWSSGGGA